MLSNSLKKPLFALALLTGLILIWVYPESDPAWWKNIEDLHDETWWAENARRKILFNNWMWGDYAGALASGPLTALWHFLSFKVFGIHFFSLRLISLLPAAAIPILLKSSPIFKDKTKDLSILILISSSAYFAISRIGYIEMMLMLICFIYLALLQRESLLFSIIAGLILTAGLLFKGSFIYLLVPLIIWTIFSTIEIKKLATILSVFAISSASIYLTYYLPNSDLFEVYSRYFKSNFYDTITLLNPLGIIPRLAWLPTKEWLTSPLMIWISITYLLKFSNGLRPSFKNTATGLLLLFLTFSLFSDFSDRRLIFLIVLIPLAWFDKFEKNMSLRTNLILSTFLLSPYITFFIQGKLNADQLIEACFFPFLALIIGVIGLYIILRKLKIKAPDIVLLRFAIAGWSLFAVHSASIVLARLQILSYSQIMVLQTLVCLLLIANAYFKYESFVKQNKILTIVCVVQFIFILGQQVHPEFTLRDESRNLSRTFNKKQEVYANNASLELLFLSKARIPFDLSMAKDHLGCDKLGLITKYSNNAIETYISSETDSNCVIKFREEINLLPFNNEYRMTSSFFVKGNVFSNQ
jgi:4-amino-4-deoxy-L-arabinose transferase-like glycosyltransferase